MSKLTDFFPFATGNQNSALLVMVGGGGGASGDQGFVQGAAGGDILCTKFTIKKGATCPIVVGAGGAAGSTSAPLVGQPGAVGGNGGYSSFGELRAPGGGGAGSMFVVTIPCAGTPYQPAFTCYQFPAFAPGGIGALPGTTCYSDVQTPRFIRALPMSYPGYVGTVARQNREVTAGCVFREVNTNGCLVCATCGPSVHLNGLLNCYYTIIGGVIPVKDCVIATCPGACLPTPKSLTYNSVCRVVCSKFYNVELSGQPYSGTFIGPLVCTATPFPSPTPYCPQIDWAPVNREQFNIAKNVLGCSRHSDGFYCAGPCGFCYRIFASNCWSVCNYPNTGHSGRTAGCNGDSGVVVVFYPTGMPEASSFPGGIDCTPVSCPFGMRAYKFTSSGSITF